MPGTDQGKCGLRSQRPTERSLISVLPPPPWEPGIGFQSDQKAQQSRSDSDPVGRRSAAAGSWEDGRGPERNCGQIRWEWRVGGRGGSSRLDRG